MLTPLNRLDSFSCAAMVAGSVMIAVLISASGLARALEERDWFGAPALRIGLVAGVRCRLHGHEPLVPGQLVQNLRDASHVAEFGLQQFDGNTLRRRHLIVHEEFHYFLLV